jgi:hypothetical protein
VSVEDVRVQVPPWVRASKINFFVCKSEIKNCTFAAASNDRWSGVGVREGNLEIEEILKRDKFIDILDTIYKQGKQRTENNTEL